MSDWREFSRLPESPDYWLGLRARIGRAADPVLAGRQARERWLDRALAGAVLAAAACVALLLAQPAAAPASPADVSIRAGLAPADPLALDLLNSGEAPPVGGLLATYAMEQADR